ncbi:MAG: efflux RND transporter periplasmic adaptor subunit [Prevotella sp.]|nr:efflux RND transporter periplasmic adaptor subunit [Prevotella sp.]
MKIKSTMIVAIAALALVSCGKKSGGSLADLQDNEFAVRTVGGSTADLQTTYPATIKGIQDVEVHPKLAGYITNLYVHEGQAVRAGQVMFTLDSETYRAAVNQAQAALNTAIAQENTTKLTYENNKKLFAQHIIGQYELSTAQNSYLTAKAQVAQARASLASARETLSWCSVVAPASGVVGDLPFKKGALVSTASTLTTVSDVSTVEVFFSMSESDILGMSKTAGSVADVLKEMPTVKLQLADGTIYNQPGRVVKMSGVIDATTGAYSLIAHFPNPQHLLKSGGAGQIIVPRVSSNAIIIPQEAVSQVQDKYFVYKVGNDNKVKYSEITVNPENDGVNYIVTSGLNVGDRYVSKGIQKLTDGMAIKPITEDQYQKMIDEAANLSKEQGSAKGFVKAMTGK